MRFPFCIMILIMLVDGVCMSDCAREGEIRWEADIQSGFLPDVSPSFRRNPFSNKATQEQEEQEEEDDDDEKQERSKERSRDYASTERSNCRFTHSLFLP